MARARLCSSLCSLVRGERPRRAARRLVYKSSGDFKLLYYVLGTLAFVTFAAALLFPAEEEKAAAKEMAA